MGGITPILHHTPFPLPEPGRRPALRKKRQARNADLAYELVNPA